MCTFFFDCVYCCWLACVFLFVSLVLFSVLACNSRWFAVCIFFGCPCAIIVCLFNVCVYCCLDWCFLLVGRVYCCWLTVRIIVVWLCVLLLVGGVNFCCLACVLLLVGRVYLFLIGCVYCYCWSCVLLLVDRVYCC